MKTVLSSPDDSNNIDKRSDMIKSEIAKYRLLKSKAAIGSHEESRDSSHKLLSKSSFSGFCSPSKAETLSNSTALQASYLQNDGSLYSSKVETRPSSTKRVGNSQPLQIQNASPIGSFSERERIRADYLLSPTAKELSQSQLHSTKSSSSNRVNLPVASYVNKKGLRNKSPIFEGYIEEKRLDHQGQVWEKIEEFVDTDLEKELLTRSVQKTSTTKNYLNSNTKIQDAAANQKRASSATDTKSKRLRENKNFTPNSSKMVTEENSNRKHSVPDSPTAAPLREESTVSKRNVLTPIQDHRNQPVNGNKQSSLVKAAQNYNPNQIISPQKAEAESEKGLKEEVEKWRIFGKMMAESYDDLNKKYTEYTKDKEKDKKIVSALKEQIRTLKALLKAAKDEQKAKSKENDLSHRKEDDKEQKEYLHLAKELEEIRNESQETIKVLEFLKNENDILKKSVEEGKKQKQLVEHYQKLADVRFKECSALAEEIICLRTDLDRSHSNYLRIQREQGSGKKLNVESFLSGKKLKQPDSLGLLGTGESKNIKRNEVKVSNWNEEIDDEPPLPADFKAIPSKEESTLI